MQAKTLILLALATIAVAPTAWTQQNERVYKIGWLWVGEPNAPSIPMEKWAGPWVPFRETLKEKGYILGKNLVVDTRDARGDIGRLPAEAAALVAAKVDVIVAPGTPAAVAAVQATQSIPIVFPGVGDPVGKRIVASLAKPGGNATGVAVNVETPKVWQWIRDVAPGTHLIGILSNARNYEGINGADDIKAYRDRKTAEYTEIAKALGVDFVTLRVSEEKDIEPMLADFANRGGTGIVIYTDSHLISWRSSIMEAVRRHKLVTACVQWFGWAKEGCVITYGEDQGFLRRTAALQVDKILRGTRPADIPVEQPTNFKLIVNAKAAKALGLAVPQSLLASADDVVE
ncbi:ABC transporter substrate-binding protein [Reyranella sp.]|uniref:ABC transporter substrate-binding protein n=1 Tax=Reyranella sp. TaxID=1929291 RepID=UPI0037837018